MSDRFEQWLASYGRVYQDAPEKDKRFQIFKENVEYIESHYDDTSKKYNLGVNEFTDLSNEEFKTMRNGYKMRPSNIVAASKTSSFSMKMLLQFHPAWIGERMELWPTLRTKANVVSNRIYK